MILHYLSELLKPTDTFRRIRKIVNTNRKQARAIKVAARAMHAVEIEVIKIDPVLRGRFQSYKAEFDSIRSSLISKVRK